MQLKTLGAKLQKMLKYSMKCFTISVSTGCSSKSRVYIYTLVPLCNAEIQISSIFFTNRGLFLFCFVLFCFVLFCFVFQAVISTRKSNNLHFCAQDFKLKEFEVMGCKEILRDEG